jgi:hypothetical protein
MYIYSDNISGSSLTQDDVMIKFCLKQLHNIYKGLTSKPGLWQDLRWVMTKKKKFDEIEQSISTCYVQPMTGFF